MNLGVAVCTTDLQDDNLSSIILAHCATVVPEYEMKWDVVAIGPEERDWSAADKIVAFAQHHGLSCRGHTLLWHRALPAWAMDLPTASFADAVLEFVDEAVTRYGGAVAYWDVCNEVLEPKDGLPGAMRRSILHDAFGMDLVRISFGRAARAEPNARLVLNEYGLERGDADGAARRAAMLDLLHRERKIGTRIDCLGLQAHLDTIDAPHNDAGFETFLRDVDRMGITVIVTELDVNDQQVQGSSAQRDAVVAETCRAFLRTVFENCDCHGVTTWGVTDQRTWLSSSAPRSDGLPPRPLLWDHAGHPKAAYTAVVEEIARARVAIRP